MSLGLNLLELRGREVRASLILLGIGVVSALIGYRLNWEPLPGMYLGFLGFGLILAGVLTIPINNYLRWMDNEAPGWFREIGYLVLVLAVFVVVTALILIGAAAR